MKRLTLLTLGLLVAACAETPTEAPRLATDSDLEPPVALSPIMHTASGSGAFELGGALRTFSFSAALAGDGSAMGRFQLYSRSSDVRLNGVITCGTIWGSVGWFGGVITSGAFVGREVNFTAFDEGAGKKGIGDGISLMAVGQPGSEIAQPYCDNTPFDRGYFLTDGVSIVAPGNTSFTSGFTFDFQLDVFIPCALDGQGEVASLAGPLQILTHFTEDQAGGFVFRSLTNPQGISGYGLTSGDAYQGTGMGGSVEHYSISGLPANFTYVDNFRIVGQGPGNNVMIHGNFHLTVNANGEVTAVADNFSATCQ